jgi:hypothetical protein
MNVKEYLLGLMGEEGSEIAQAANKCARFTMDHRYYAESNFERLNTELGDLFSVMYLLEEELKVEFVKTHNPEKIERIRQTMQLSRDMGTLHD